MAERHICVRCGGPVDEDGRALPLAPTVRMERRTAAASPPQVQPEDDPLQHLTPGERYARAIDRRDTLIRDRRRSERPGRRTTDQPGAGDTGMP